MRTGKVRKTKLIAAGVRWLQVAGLSACLRYCRVAQGLWRDHYTADKGHLTRQGGQLVGCGAIAQRRLAGVILEDL